MTTKRLLPFALAVSLFTFIGFNSRAEVKPAQAPAGASDLKRLQVEVQQLKEQLARLQNQRAGSQTPSKPKETEDFINLKSFGAKGDGVTDDTAAIQAALEAAGNNAPWGTRGTMIMVPPGEYLLSSTLNVRRMAFEMVGCGYGNSLAYAASPGKASVFRWNGPPNVPMMKIRDSNGISIRRIRFEGKVGVAGTSAINLNWIAEDQQGTNGGTVIEQCYFGRYSHTGQGIWKGDLAYGILMDGENGNNDEFRIERCAFISCTKAGTRIANTQSVWGSINNCTMSGCGVGVETAAHLTGYNVCFDSCDLDFNVVSTAHVRVFGWQSEHSKRLANLNPDAALFADGGYIQLDAITGGVMINAFPTDSAQLLLSNIQFTQNTLSPRPQIRFGPSQKDVVDGLDFRIKVTDSTGLYPDQFQLAGRLWAESPESRGEVEFQGSADRMYHFHNFLRMKPTSAQTLDTSRVDLAVADAAPTINAPGPIGVQWTLAKVYAGSGSPENVVAASVGSLFMRTDGGKGATLYVKESGDEKTGWIAK